MKSSPPRFQVRLEGESIVSAICGLTALFSGSGAILLLASYFMGNHFGGELFYHADAVLVGVTTRSGEVITREQSFMIPSFYLIGVLFIGTLLGAIGMGESVRRGRSATCTAGLIACAFAWIAVLSLWAWAGSLQ